MHLLIYRFLTVVQMKPVRGAASGHGWSRDRVHDTQVVIRAMMMEVASTS
jgi:hypothetical protein